MKLDWPATALSLIGHAGLLLLLVLFASPHTLPEVPKAMQAMLVSPPSAPSTTTSAQAMPMPVEAPAEQTVEPVIKAPAVVKPEPLITPTADTATLKKTEPAKKSESVKKSEPVKKPELLKKPDAVKTPEPDEVKPDPAAEAKRVADEAKRIADAAQAKQTADAKRKQQEAIAAQMQSEIDDLANNAANAALAKQQAAQLREFTSAINKKIKSQWRRPPQVSGQLATLLRITVFPGGEVSSVIITKTSGNTAFDASVKDAVLRASPLPVPADAKLFRDNFSVFALNYTTEE